MVKIAATELTKIGSCFDHQGDRVIVKATPENHLRDSFLPDEMVNHKYKHFLKMKTQRSNYSVREKSKLMNLWL